MPDSVDTAGFISKLTLHDKASLGSGASYWITESVEGLPPVVLEDGPHGVRHQEAAPDHKGIAPSAPATCFPPATALAQTWDPDIIESVGAALGREARSLGVDVLLGPGVNIKRDPRCGRNFEYFSEDPLLSGVIGSAWVRGLQSMGVGASVKHFAANNQEFERMRASSDIDERTLREIYLRSFERVIRAAEPWTVMASYNRLNGTPATEHHWLLTEVLRDEWGFKGAVISDWGAVGDRVRAVAAGLDLQMPGGDRTADDEVVAAVREGRLDEAVVDGSVSRVVDLALRASEGREAFHSAKFDQEEHHAFAREVAGRAIVLLKNDGDLLPLAPTQSVAVIGPFATEPRIQGGGSSRVNATKIDIALDEMIRLSDPTRIRFAEGYRHEEDECPELAAEAVEAARESDVAVVFLGLTAEQEAEGTDRPNIDLPPVQLELLNKIVAAQPSTIVVLVHGGVVCLSEVEPKVPAMLDCCILGQAGGGAIADVLFGEVNPSGRLAETAPRRLQDAPSFLNYPGDQLHVRYGEGIFVGYRGYDQLQHQVVFPFGHGLAYTRFSYSDLNVTSAPEGLQLSLTITNTGMRDGREIAQFYVEKPDGVVRPPRELKAFTNVYVKAGESAQVELLIPRNDLAYWDIRLHQWVVEGGTYLLHAAASSRDLRLSATVEVEGDGTRVPFSENSTVGELMSHPESAAIIAAVLRPESDDAENVASRELGIDVRKSALRIPVGRIRTLSGGRNLPPAQLQELLAKVNESV